MVVISIIQWGTNPPPPTYWNAHFVLGFFVFAGFIANSILGMSINIFTIKDLFSSSFISILRTIHRYAGAIFFIFAFANIIGGWDQHIINSRSAVGITSTYIAIAIIIYLILLITGYRYS